MILVVDDSPTVRRQVQVALSDAGYSVVEATDGIDALEKLKGAGDIRLMVADVNMPRMNGLELLERVKQTNASPGLVVLMLTSDGQPSMIERARQAGASGWLVKPFKPELLLAAIKKLLPLQVSARA
jgi:two-component system chemotaxis response regulator CheY